MSLSNHLVSTSSTGMLKGCRSYAMPPQTQHPELQRWQRLAGTWATEATHPALPGTVVTGQATFEWLEDQRFLIQRSHYDHPAIPDAISFIRLIDGKRPTQYFDSPRGHRWFP